MTKVKLLQLNIFKGKYLEELIVFIRKEDPDFITMQEVTVSGFNLYEDKRANLFDMLRHGLGMDAVYNGDLILKGDPNSKFGNAVFSKSEILNKEVITLKDFRPVTLEEIDGRYAFEIRPRLARHMLSVQVKLNGRNVNILSWHGAWTAPPTDTPETLRQARIVADYLEQLNEPFILGGDLNNIIESKTVGLISNVARNLMIGKNIKETTNPKVHKISPRGFLVDYIFASDHFQLINIDVPEVTVSDHLPVVAQLEMV